MKIQNYTRLLLGGVMFIVASMTAVAESPNAVVQKSIDYAEGNGVVKDWEACERYAKEGLQNADASDINWLKSEAESGRAAAQWILCMCYRMGIVVEEDDREAMRWLRSAAEKGHAYALCNMGEIYLYGEPSLGIERNVEKALGYYTRSAERGCVQAQYQLGELYLGSKGVHPDYEKAFKWLIVAARDRKSSHGDMAMSLLKETLEMAQDLSTSSDAQFQSQGEEILRAFKNVTREK